MSSENDKGPEQEEQFVPEEEGIEATDAVEKNNANDAPAQEQVAITFTVSSEKWRFIAYLFFWSMCIFAIILSTTLVGPILAAGPEDGSSCGPYNRNSPDFGVLPGEGFDLATQSHLIQLFGFNNICANWDYSPSRELTAMVYPLFEYSLIIYICLDFMVTSIANKRGELEKWFWTFSKVIFPICIFLCSQFRMIFVCLAYENVQQHTAGFLGLQVALILVALQNSLFIWDANIKYDMLGPEVKHTRRVVVAYLVGDLIISCIKISATIHVVTNGVGAPWTIEPSGISGVVVGQIVDWIWMLFNAVIPLVVAFFRSRNEVPLTITFYQDVAGVDVQS